MPGFCISGDLARESPLQSKEKAPRRVNVRGNDLEVLKRRGKKRLADQPPQVKLGGGFFVPARSNRQAVTPIAVRQRRPARLEATLRLLKNRAEQELGPSLVRRIAAACMDRLDELRSACLPSGKSNHPGSKYGPALTANRPDQRAAAGTLGDAKCRASLNTA